MTINAASGDSPETQVHPSSPVHEGAIVQQTHVLDDHAGAGVEGVFDPDTLANLAVLSRVDHDDGSHMDPNADAFFGDAEGIPTLLAGGVTSEQVQEIVDRLEAMEEEIRGYGDAEDGASSEREGRFEEIEEDDDRVKEDESIVADGDKLLEEEERDSEEGSDRSMDEDEEFWDPRDISERGRLKRRRNRTTL